MTTAPSSSSITAAHPADALLDAIDRRSAPVCVGLDPVVNRLPEKLQPHGSAPASAVRAIRDYSLHVIDAVVEHVPCIKIQSACFERYRHLGVQAMYELIAEARQRGLRVILDAKRGDIGISAEHYAAAAFQPPPGHEHERVDWLTVNGYLGMDALEPFLPDNASGDGGGVFVLARTSNPGSDAWQAQRLESGRTIAEQMAAMIAEFGKSRIGSRGYSAVGAVVGATKPQDAARLREIMPQQLFLVPGFGAQGGTVNDVLACFQRDTKGSMSGAVITASRSVIYAFEKNADVPWTQAVSEAAAGLADTVGKAIGAR